MKLPGLVIVTGLLLAGCGGDKEGTEPTKPPTQATSGGGNQPPVTDAKVKTTDVKVGKGAVAEKGDTVWMEYRGTLLDGTEFDSNMDPGEDPYALVLGAGEVIAGWDQGIPGMKVGGERTLEIPAVLGYGAQGGPGGRIPPNSDLKFTVKLLGVVKPGEEKVIDRIDIKKGNGARVVKVGDKVKIHYTTKLSNGRLLEDSRKTKSPLSFTVGSEEVLSPLDRGVEGMSVGGRRLVIAPPLVAYAARPTPGIPPNSLIHFEIELLSVN